MKKIENTALQMIAEASRCPDYGPDMVKSLMKKLDMNEKGFGNTSSNLEAIRTAATETATQMVTSISA